MKDERDKGLMLWYTRPAKKWTEALPLGNGHMGAMVFGGAASEKITLTEITCYSGEASLDNNQEGASQVIPQIREALFEHDYSKAGQLADKIIGRKLNYGTNLPFGNLILNFDLKTNEITGYRRELQLDRAVSCVEYCADGRYYIREMFISNPHRILVMRISCSLAGGLDFKASLDGASNPHTREIDENGDMLLKGYAYENCHSDGRTGVALYGRMRIIAQNGVVSGEDNMLQVKGADSAIVFVALSTDFADKDMEMSCRKWMNTAVEKAYEDLRCIHISEHQRLFHRVNLSIGDILYPRIPTDERLKAVNNGAEDPSLAALMFQYGRYLLMSGSRDNSPLPAHLQGIWNDNIACRMGWTCDMHLDINTEMNYWPSEVTNLSECNMPFFEWIEERLIPSGKHTAKTMYGLDGWVAHVVSNAWGYSAPGWVASWGIHPTGGLWAATHMWEHYLFTGDKDFLKNRLVPVYREAVRFFVKYLVKDPISGYYLSGPSMSPENGFVYDWYDKVFSSLSMGAVCDTVIIRELFRSFITACDILGLEEELLTETKEKLERLPPFKAGKSGQLQEWFYDFDELDPHHRHTSHLLSVFPFCQITPDKNPELAKAAPVSIRKRTNPDWRWEDTGWARALLILYAARLRQPEEAWQHILAFQRGLTNTNLLSYCPPGAGAETDVFEMDGTTGFCSGIAEMLMQSHNGEIHILPALPQQWPEGCVKGLRARGGFEVSITWENNQPVRICILSILGEPLKVRYKDQCIELLLRKNEKCVLDKLLKLI